MKARFTTAFDATLATNLNGEIKNLLITDGDADFLECARYALRCWSQEKGIHLVEIDEQDDSWLHEIRSRELFDKLNRPNTVLLIKNYATVPFHSVDENTPRNFLRDVVLKRHYGCGNDFVPSDDLPNLLFVVAINDLSRMRWRPNEYASFAIIHQDDTKKVWTNTSITSLSSKMHPVMSAENKEKFLVSDDETTLCVDVEDVFMRLRVRHPIRYQTAEARTEMFHAYIESYLPDFHDQVVCLILKSSNSDGEERFVIDGRQLRKAFPKLGTICCKDNIEIVNIDDEMCVLDPFDLGEMCFYLALEGDIPMANTFVRDLWALDPKWARFFRGVAKDYYRKPEDHAKPNSNGTGRERTGMDHLFHIYLLGWYSSDDSFDSDHRVLVGKHKNFDKAIGLIPIRFQNCSVDEVAEKLYWDFQYLKNEENPDYEQFTKVLHEADRLVPGILAQMYHDGRIPQWLITGKK